MEVSGSLRGACSLPRACPAAAVQGQAWFDHQWGDFRIDLFGGWDWFALQFDDGADLMLYLIRGEDGAVASAAGSYVTADGRTLPLAEGDFVLEPTGAVWTSPATAATYPAGWRVRVPAHDVDALVVPMVADQEMDTRATTRIVYWEGAVDVGGERPGVGFVELTNYDRVPIAATER
jgi:predicted secreted hydrolase